MIKFFRRIRQRLLAENKFSKYLFYAIGEIILVVVGILIALKVNNWNQDRKAGLEEQMMLINLRQEFQLSLEELKKKNFQRNKVLESNYSLTEIILDKDFSNTIRIDSLLEKSIFVPTYNGKSGALDLTINSGKFNLLKNETLKEKLLAWPSRVENTIEDEAIHVSFIWEEVVPLYRRYVRFNKITRSAGQRISNHIAKRQGNMEDDYEGLFINPEFESILYQIEYFAVIEIVVSEELMEHAEQILSLIDKELNE